MPKASLAKLRKLQEEAEALFYGRNLPLPDEAGLTLLRRFLLFSARVYHSFSRNRCPVRAAALAYTNLLALVPLLAVAVSVSAAFLKSKGEESIQEWIREAIVRVAPMLGLKEAAEPVSILFTPQDVKDLDALVAQLRTSSDPLSRYLWDDRFTSTNKQVLLNPALPLPERKFTLVAELNRVLTAGSIYEARRFAGVKNLSVRTKNALEEHEPKDEDLMRLNRYLLSDAYGLGQDALDAVLSSLTGYIANFQSGKLGVSAILALIFVAISLLATVETTFNDMWGVPRGRGWFARVVQYWAALSLGPLFFFSALTLTTWLKIPENMAVAGFLGKFILPLVILSLGCALLYLVMPNTKVPWQAALLGGGVAGVLLQLNSFASVFYVSRVLTYNQIYGSMATLPLFLIGLYISWWVVLLGAQVAYAYQNRRTYAQERRAENINQRGREFAALRLMVRIAERFHAGQRPPTGPELADDLRIPLRLVGQLMSVLLTTGLVLEVTGSETAYAPGRPLSQITVRDIMQALRAGQGQDLATCEDATRPIVAGEFETVERSWQDVAGASNLEDLARRVAAVAAPSEPSPCRTEAASA